MLLSDYVVYMYGLKYEVAQISLGFFFFFFLHSSEI